LFVKKLQISDAWLLACTCLCGTNVLCIFVCIHLIDPEVFLFMAWSYWDVLSSWKLRNAGGAILITNTCSNISVYFWVSKTRMCVFVCSSRGRLYGNDGIKRLKWINILRNIKQQRCIQDQLHIGKQINTGNYFLPISTEIFLCLTRCVKKTIHQRRLSSFIYYWQLLYIMYVTYMFLILKIIIVYVSVMQPKKMDARVIDYKLYIISLNSTSFNL
jgi:hypothetical protein